MRVARVDKEKFHEITVAGNSADVTMAATYLPSIGQKEYALLSHYVDLLNDMAPLERLDS